MNKTHAEVAQELSDNLNKMHESRMINESVLSQIDEIINAIYKEENKKFNEDNDQCDPDNPDYCPDAPLYLLIDYVQDKDQYIKDFRNAIHISLHSDRYISDIEEAVEKVIHLRAS